MSTVNRAKAILVALIVASAMATTMAQPAQAHGGGHYAVDFAGWLSECYYGGYSWYDYYYHNGIYYWDWC